MPLCPSDLTGDWRQDFLLSRGWQPQPMLCLDPPDPRGCANDLPSEKEGPTNTHTHKKNMTLCTKQSTHNIYVIYPPKTKHNHYSFINTERDETNEKTSQQNQASQSK